MRSQDFCLGRPKPQIIRNMMSLEIFKRTDFLWDKIPNDGSLEAWGVGWCVNKMLLKGEDLNQLTSSKYVLNFGGVVKKLI